MGGQCGRCVVDNIREELWSYFALSGILLLQGGIVLLVYALKRATLHPEVVKALGIFLIVMGILATLISWYAHRQHRRKEKLRWRDLYRSCCVPRVRNASSQEVLVERRGIQADDATAAPKYSTPEFQRYAEFIKRDNSGVGHNGTPGGHRKSATSSPKRTHVHPRDTPDDSHTTVFSNPRCAPRVYTISRRERHSDQAPRRNIALPLMSPIMLQAIRLKTTS
ncbi:uncharacterized protein LOC106013795 [Aplysia californica]|uniref:Uncharacterized protein LOC106013795 n=1 Tax=Aplysia californica TaxID=6500 RepID=A0ABM1AE20_APLCA|nr:uncharacterized protein LOC106013795 [Aplysia californica]